VRADDDVRRTWLRVHDDGLVRCVYDPESQGIIKPYRVISHIVVEVCLDTAEPDIFVDKAAQQGVVVSRPIVVDRGDAPFVAVNVNLPTQIDYSGYGSNSRQLIARTLSSSKNVR
jgi:hypothetical protein